MLSNKNKFDLYWHLLERPKRIIGYYWNYKIMTRDNAFLIQREANKYRNQIIIDPPFNIVKLLGWTDQYESDYYWIYWTKERGLGEKIALYSCCGGFIPLKGRLPGFYYYQMEEYWKLNCSMDIASELDRLGIILK